MSRIRMLASRRRVLAGAVASVATLAAPVVLRAQGGALKVGVLLPRSGLQAGLGQDCQRGVDIAPGILKSLGLPELAIMNGDTELNVDTARTRAEKLIGDGAQLLVGAFELRADNGDRPGSRAEEHSTRHQHRCGPGDHGARLQVRIQEFSDRADNSRRCIRQPEGGVRCRRRGAQERRVHARKRYLRHGNGQGHRRDHAEVRHAVQDRRGDRLRSGSA